VRDVVCALAVGIVTSCHRGVWTGTGSGSKWQ
jgi:hypothetical protein